MSTLLILKRVKNMTQKNNYDDYRKEHKEHKLDSYIKLYGSLFFDLLSVPNTIIAGIIAAPLAALYAISSHRNPIATAIALGVEAGIGAKAVFTIVGFLVGLPLDGLVAIGLFPGLKATDLLTDDPEETNSLPTEHGELEAAGLLPDGNDNPY